MPCFSPNPVFFASRPDGKRDVVFKNSREDKSLFQRGLPVTVFTHPDTGEVVNSKLPCGNCIGCRLEKSRQWAVRMVNEAQMYEENSFVTLTFSPEFLPKDGSLDISHMTDFLHRLRSKLRYGVKYLDRFGVERVFKRDNIRYFYCGEYGDKLGRPHYHIAFFNLDVPDKVYWKSVNGFKYYTSKILSDVWQNGFITIGELTFESAAYIARYVTKKINGSMADSHYGGRKPEFCRMSLRPGIGKTWFDKFGSDVYPLDEVVSRGHKAKPPRYYDKLLERYNPEMFLSVKRERVNKNILREEDSFQRLLDKQKCTVAKMKRLVRSMEAEA